MFFSFLISKLKKVRWDIVFFSKAVLVALLFVGIWEMMRRSGIALKKESEGLVTTGVLVVIGSIYSIITGKTFESTWEKQKGMAAGIVERNLLKYLFYRDEYVPMVAHYAVQAVSLLLIGYISILHFDEEVCGILSIWGVSFVVALLYFVIQALDDPRESPWFKGKTPKGWTEETMDTYWAKEDAKKAAGAILCPAPSVT